MTVLFKIWLKEIFTIYINMFWVFFKCTVFKSTFDGEEIVSTKKYLSEVHEILSKPLE